MQILALDIGGTAIKAALFDQSDHIVWARETPSRGREGGPRLLEVAFALADQCPPFEGIGICSTGQVDAKSGRIVYANDNVPNYTGMEVRRLFEERYRVPATLENDVNAAALGEARYGAGRGVEDFLCLTYGTGIGGGIIIHGDVYSGHLGLAGEVGHIVTHPGGRQCTCGQKGCYEQYASATALMRMARAVAPDLEDGKAFFTALEHTPALEEVLEAWALEVTYGLVTLTHTLNPSLLVLGGGIMTQPRALKVLKKTFHGRIMSSYEPVTLKAAELGNRAGAYGSLHQIRERMEKESAHG